MTNPVLFIGLGGTGKQTLMHLRRLFLDNYGPGSVPKSVLERYGPGRLPHTAFLCFDSDTRLLDLDGQRFDELLESAQLTGSEFQALEIDQEQMKEFYQHPERFPAYKPWYDFGLEKFGVPRHGCGQTRPWGRYAFFQHYSKIRSSVRAALDSLTNARTVADAQEMGVTLQTDGPLLVFVVFSIAGGTGSGMFLDMAFLLRDLESEIGRAMPSQAVILLPGAFSSNPEAKIYANSYAALLELEHYNLQRDESSDAAQRGFPIYWPGAFNPDQGPRRLMPPAFEAAWLIGERSRGPSGAGGSAVDPSRKSELTGMMAEWLFLRASPNHAVIGSQINSDAGNYTVNEMAETAALPIYEAGSSEPQGRLELSRRYGSFGLSKIYLPKGILHQIAAHRLVGDILRQWATEPPLGAGATATLEREVWPKVLLRQASASGRDRQGAAAIFEFVDRANGSTSVIDEAMKAFEQAFDPRAIAEKERNNLPAALAEQFDEFVRRRVGDDEVDAKKQGDLARRIHKNRDLAKTTIREALDEVLADSLRTHGRRFSFAREVLLKLSADFANAAAEADRQQADRADRASEARRNVDVILRYAREEQSDFVLGKIATVATRLQEDVIGFELERQIFQRSKEVAEYAVNLIGRVDDKAGVGEKASGLFHQLTELRRDLERLERRVSQRVADLRVRPTSTLNQRVIADTDDAYYLDSDGGPITVEYVLGSEARVLVEPAVFNGQVGSPWSLRNRFAGSGSDQLLDELVEFGRREMDHVPQLANNALATFDALYPSGGGKNEYAAALQPRVSNASAWLAITSVGESSWGRNARIAQTLRVGYRPTGGSEQRRLTDAVVGPNALFPGLNAQVAELQQGDSVYFEQEIAGFPLSVIPNIKDYRDRSYVPYLTEQSRGGKDSEEGASSALHIEPDGAKFGSIIQPTPEEASARAAAVELFAEAVAKRRLKPKRDSFGMITFGRETQVGFTPVEQEVGRYDRAVLMLISPQSKANRELRAGNQEIEDLWDKRPDGGREVKAQLLALLDYYLFDPHRPITLPEWDTALKRLIERLTRRYGEDRSQAARELRASLPRWTTEDPPGSGFRHLSSS